MLSEEGEYWVPFQIMVARALYRPICEEGITKVQACTAELGGYLRIGNYRGLFREFTSQELSVLNLQRLPEQLDRTLTTPGELVDGNHKAFVLQR